MEMASFLGPGRFEVIVDREKFEKELVCYQYTPLLGAVE